MATLLVAPWAAWTAGQTTYAGEVRANAWERQHDVAATAVLLENAPAGVPSGTDSVPRTVPARAYWIGPDGMRRTGYVDAVPREPAGSTVAVWVDEHGAVVPAPARRKPMVDAVASGLLAVCLIACGIAGLHRIVAWRLNRRRLREWQAQWLIVEPLWSRR
jgi:hypothetical protein